MKREKEEIWLCHTTTYFEVPLANPLLFLLKARTRSSVLIFSMHMKILDFPSRSFACSDMS